MTEALLFLLGFSSVVGVYEVAATGRRTKTDRLQKAAEKTARLK